MSLPAVGDWIVVYDIVGPCRVVMLDPEDSSSPMAVIPDRAWNPWVTGRITHGTLRSYASDAQWSIGQLYGWSSGQGWRPATPEELAKRLLAGLEGL